MKTTKVAGKFYTFLHHKIGWKIFYTFPFDERDHHKSGWKSFTDKSSHKWPLTLWFVRPPTILSLLQSTVMERYSPLELVGGSHFCGPETGHVQAPLSPPTPLLSLFPKSSTLDDMMI
jgi:hypothetical protein